MNLINKCRKKRAKAVARVVNASGCDIIVNGKGFETYFSSLPDAKYFYNKIMGYLQANNKFYVQVKGGGLKSQKISVLTSVAKFICQNDPSITNKLISEGIYIDEPYKQVLRKKPGFYKNRAQKPHNKR